MKRTLLAVLAHPDDESFGIGGTLARYAQEGVDVHVAIATDGVAGSVVEEYEETLDQLVAVRTKEVKSAVKILGGTLHLLCYRDSGYIGDPANHHPDAFIQADEREVVGRIVKLIREIRPQVIITHDETGGYFHPDHVFCCQVTTAAFHAAGDAEQYPEVGPAAHRSQKLYYAALPKRWVKFFALLMRLRGQDPTKVGRNNDIDMTQVGVPPHKINAYIDYRPYWELKVAAGAQHPSQGGGPGFSSILPTWLQKRLFGRESFMRAYPPVLNGSREDDLFAGIEEEI